MEGLVCPTQTVNLLDEPELSPELLAEFGRLEAEIFTEEEGTDDGFDNDALNGENPFDRIATRAPEIDPFPTDEDPFSEENFEGNRPINPLGGFPTSRPPIPRK